MTAVGGCAANCCESVTKPYGDALCGEPGKKINLRVCSLQLFKVLFSTADKFSVFCNVVLGHFRKPPPKDFWREWWLKNVIMCSYYISKSSKVGALRIWQLHRNISRLEEFFVSWSLWPCFFLENHPHSGKFFAIDFERSSEFRRIVTKSHIVTIHKCDCVYTMS